MNKLSKIDSLKRKELQRTRDGIQLRIKATQKLLVDISKVQTSLEGELFSLINEIGSRGDTLKDAIDNYVKKAKAAMINAHEENMEKIQNYKEALDKKLKDHEESVLKINNVLEQGKQTGQPLVNVAKVYEMIIDSIDDSKSLQVNFNIRRCRLRTSSDINIKEVIGAVSNSEEGLYGIMYPVKFLGEFKTPNIDINAITSNGQHSSNSIWVCFGVKKELVCYNNQGKMMSRVCCDFKVNDLIETEDGRLLATSPDTKAVRCLSRHKKNGDFKCSVLAQDNLYLHGLTLCNRNGMFAVCGTDAPNYTDKKPNETVIVEYTYSGKEFRRVMVSNFSGKVYRIAQNIDDRYVLTFPKEGMVLSVDGVGNIRNSFSSHDFQECYSVPTRFGSETTFWPSGVTCDAVGHVIVTEWTNSLVMLFDRNLNLLRYIGKGLSGPNAVTYDKKLNTLHLGDRETISLWKTCPHVS